MSTVEGTQPQGVELPGRVADRYDAIVVGGGHNGLTCAAYLAREGVRVLVIEARDTVGGCASTVDALGGARVNICNCDHSLVRSTGVIEDLDLAAHGLTYLEMEPAQLLVPWNGTPPWMLFRDVERTLQSLALSHPSQVEGYRRYVRDLVPAAELVLSMTAGPPRIGPVARRIAARRGRGLRALMRLSRSSCADVLADYFTDEALLAGPATTGPAVWGLPPQTAGTGLGALGYALRHVMPVGRPIGGSGALTDALASAVRAAGGTILTGARVAGIRCVGAAAAGVTLADGRRIDAPTVIAAGDPRSTIVDLLEGGGDRAQGLVDRWKARPGGDGYESKIDAVVGSVPRLIGLGDAHAAAVGADEPMISTLVVTPTMSELAQAAAGASRGLVARRPAMLANVPSLLDETVAPPDGGHVFSLEVLFTPYELAGGWDGSSEPERWLAAFGSLVEPGFVESVQRWRLVGPREYERDFSMPRGYAPSFAGGPLSALLGKDRELTRYATPVPGLFLTGAGTFPGAGVSGAPGRNAAQVVLAGPAGRLPAALRNARSVKQDRGRPKHRSFVQNLPYGRSITSWIRCTGRTTEYRPVRASFAVNAAPPGGGRRGTRD